MLMALACHGTLIAASDKWSERMTTKRFDGAMLARELARCEQTGAIGHVTIEYWVGGGLPPPNYRSEQLRMFATTTGTVLEFAKVIWDKNYDPPNLHQKWTIPATPEDVRQLAHLLSTSGLLTIAANPPRPTDRPDAIAREFIVGVKDTTEMTVRFEQPAEVPQALLQHVEGLVKRVQASAQPVLFHQGKPLK